MVGRDFVYNVNCPRCGHEINNKSFNDKTSYDYHDEEVVKEKCPKCGRHFLVKLDKYIIPVIDFEHAQPIIQEKYSWINEPQEDIFKRLLNDNKFVTSKEDLCVADYNREDLRPIMY